MVSVASTGPSTSTLCGCRRRLRSSIGYESRKATFGAVATVIGPHRHSTSRRKIAVTKEKRYRNPEHCLVSFWTVGTAPVRGETAGCPKQDSPVFAAVL